MEFRIAFAARFERTVPVLLAGGCRLGLCVANEGEVEHSGRTSDSGLGTRVRRNLHDAFHNSRLEGAHWFVGWRSECGARAQAKLSAVARADHSVIFDHAAGELAAVVRAHVFDRVKLPKDIEDGHQRAVDFNLRIVSRRDFGDRRNGDPIRILASH